MFSRVCIVLAITAAVLCSGADYLAEFKDKVVLVTGGSSGIGYQTALQFAQYGAKVIITARDSNADWFNGANAVTNILADPVVQQNGGQARFVKTDMSDVEQVKALFQDIESNENDLDFAVNSAGIGGPLGELTEVSSYIHGEHCPIRNNLYGTIYSLMYESRFFIAKNHTGAIVNLASVNGLKATPQGSLYGTSKFGIVGLTRSVADSFADGSNGLPKIRVNAVAPTLTNTSLTWQQVKWMKDGTMPWDGDYITPDSPLWQQYGSQWIASLPSKAIASPKNMADPVLFLCSSDASFITGSILTVDRGSLA